MKNLSKVLLIFLLFLTPTLSSAVLPYSDTMQIDSIEPNYACLQITGQPGYVEIVNNCDWEFYFYNENGELDESLVLKSKGRVERKKEVQFFKNIDCVPPNDSQIIGGVDVCKDKLHEGILKKRWTIKMLSSKDNQNIVIKGRTLQSFNGSVDADILFNLGYTIIWSTAILLMIAALLLIMLKYAFKKKISSIFIVILFIISILIALYGLAGLFSG